jgi:hypothetical protein
VLPLKPSRGQGSNDGSKRGTRIIRRKLDLQAALPAADQRALDDRGALSPSFIAGR